MQKRTTKLKIGVIGVGHMGQYHVNVLSGLPTHQFIGIYDANYERASEIAEKFETRAFKSLDQLISKVDAVTIAVPTNLHYETAMAALKAGKHVLVEKPITENTEQARELVDLAAEKKLVLQVGHVERFNGAVMELHKIVTEPRLIETKRLSPFTPRIKDVGVILDMMIHDLDIVLNLVDSKVVSWSAVGSSVLTEHEDLAVITLQFENGCVASLTGSRLSQNKERTLNIIQDKSYINLNYANQDIEIYRQGSSAYLMTPEEIKYSQESFVEKLYVHKDNPLKSEHIHFYDCIIDGKQPYVLNEKDIETLALALNSVQAIQRWIKVHREEDAGQKEEAAETQQKKEESESNE